MRAHKFSSQGSWPDNKIIKWNTNRIERKFLRNPFYNTKSSSMFKSGCMAAASYSSGLAFVYPSSCFYSCVFFGFGPAIFQQTNVCLFGYVEAWRVSNPSPQPPPPPTHRWLMVASIPSMWWRLNSTKMPLHLVSLSSRATKTTDCRCGGSMGSKFVQLCSGKSLTITMKKAFLAYFSRVESHRECCAMWGLSLNQTNECNVGLCCSGKTQSCD